VGVASSCGRAPRAKKHGVPGAAGRRKVICRTHGTGGTVTSLLILARVDGN
jgi:hypothetical protein